MINKIQQGDVVKCLWCGVRLKINTYTYLYGATGEYIRCLKCNMTYDVRQYMIYGTKIMGGENETN